MNVSNDFIDVSLLFSQKKKVLNRLCHLPEYIICHKSTQSDSLMAVLLNYWQTISQELRNKYWRDVQYPKHREIRFILWKCLRYQGIESNDRPKHNYKLIGQEQVNSSEEINY